MPAVTANDRAKICRALRGIGFTLTHRSGRGKSLYYYHTLAGLEVRVSDHAVPHTEERAAARESGARTWSATWRSFVVGGDVPPTEWLAEVREQVAETLAERAEIAQQHRAAAAKLDTPERRELLAALASVGEDAEYRGARKITLSDGRCRVFFPSTGGVEIATFSGDWTARGSYEIGEREQVATAAQLAAYIGD